MKKIGVSLLALAALGFAVMLPSTGGPAPQARAGVWVPFTAHAHPAKTMP